MSFTLPSENLLASVGCSSSCASGDRVAIPRKKKKLKNYPPGPDTKFLERKLKKYKKYSNDTFWGVFVFFEFFFGEFGIGAQG